MSDVARLPGRQPDRITRYEKGGLVPPSSSDPVSGWRLWGIEDVTVIGRLLEARHGKIKDLLISQLRRDAERGHHRPELSDLMESGRIEEAAKAVLLLYDESPKPISGGHSVEVIVAKNRMGETGTCRMTFWPAWCGFTDGS